MKLLVKILGSSKELLDYCFYRITRFYLTHDSKYVKFYSTQYGGGLTFGLLGFLFVSLVLCPLSALLKVNLIAYRLFWFDKNTPALSFLSRRRRKQLQKVNTFSSLLNS